MKNFRFAICAGLIGGVIGLSAPAVSHADAFIQEIKNKAALTEANDLTLVFNNPPSNVRIVNPGGGDDIAPNSGTNTSSSWSTGAFPGTVKPNGSLQIKFEGFPGTSIKKADSFWTQNGAQIIDAMASIGQPPGIFGATALFTNPETFALSYTGVQLFSGNNPANWISGDFEVPTGTPVAGVPSAFALAPGQSASFSFGLIGADSYQLILANVAPVGVPTDVYFVASAAVPEPGSIAMLAGGMVLLAAVVRRRTTRYRRQ